MGPEVAMGRELRLESRLPGYLNLALAMAIAKLGRRHIARACWGGMGRVPPGHGNEYGGVRGGAKQAWNRTPFTKQKRFPDFGRTKTKQPCGIPEQSQWSEQNHRTKTNLRTFENEQPPNIEQNKGRTKQENTVHCHAWPGGLHELARGEAGAHHPGLSRSRTQRSQNTVMASAVGHDNSMTIAVMVIVTDTGLDV